LPSLLGSTTIWSLSESRAEVFDTAIQRRELRVVGFGNVDTNRLVKRDDEVMQIHRIDVDPLPKADI
jgi:hypothetical protein